MDCDVGDVGADDLDGGFSTSGDFPKRGGDACIGTHVPFSGSFKGATWNAQALFAVGTRKHLRKRSRAKALMYSYDFVCFQETHAQEGRTLALDVPQGYCALWANGTARQGGVGLAVRGAYR